MAPTANSPRQASLFASAPPGLEYQDEFVTPAVELELLEQAAALPFKPFQFQGWEGKRETVSFGWRYDFNDSRLHAAPPIPEFLAPLRERAARFAGVATEGFEQALVIRYGIGAGIGWHRDRPVFDRVFGLSLASRTQLRFRRRMAKGFDRFTLDAAARSAYLLTGEVRHEWEHSIAPVSELRYSITFRSRRLEFRQPPRSNSSSRAVA